MTTRRERKLVRKLELVVSNTFSGPKGPTLIEKMEALLDATMRARQEMIAETSGTARPRGEEIELGLALAKNRGEIEGMIKMLVIMRQPTTAKTELARAKARIKEMIVDE